MVSLRPYQVEAKEAIEKDWNEFTKVLLVLPTGCGKTIVFASIAAEQSRKGRVLILAHREELLSQASEKLKASFGLDTVLEKADSSCIGSDIPIVVGSIQSLQAEKRLSKFPQDYFSTIIVDEAHHCLSEGYQKVLNHFSGAKVLGVTATPDRGDMKMLGEYFETLSYEYSLRDAVKSGYLSKIQVQTIPLNIDLRKVKTQAGDYALNEVGITIEPYLEDIANEMATICKGKHTVVFLPLINIAQKFRDILNRKGLRAAEVNGQSEHREEILQEFSEGKFDVLCNAMLLTEGWDCPIVDCIVVLRPTKVRSLYCQMIGRGTRLYPGKDHLLILDFLWMTGTHRLVQPADIICKKKEVAEDVTKKLEKLGTEQDLFALERDVVEERKNSLLKKLQEDEAKKRRKEKKIFDPLEFELEIGDEDLASYEPIFGWQSDPASEKQLGYLEKMQIDGTGMTKGQAKVLIDKCSKRMSEGLTTPRQIKCLSKMGFKRVPEWTKDEASKIIAELSAVHWQAWKAHIVPSYYLPERLKK